MILILQRAAYRVGDWKYLAGEWWASQRIKARAKSLMKEHTLFSLQVLHGHRLNRLKQWTLATSSVNPQSPIFSRAMLERCLRTERRLVKEAELACILKTIEQTIDGAAEQMIAEREQELK